jgi:cytochrome c oxidase cbb3-type subunit IV
MATFELLRGFVAKWGFIYFALLFAVGCGYALWPSKKKHFEQAARLPLNED